MSTVGVAMIVKDGAATMREALSPFVGIADEISIVLGGKSEDETPEIAAEYAHVVSSYDEPFRFDKARQQSFDQLSTDWVIVVDADDVWHNASHLPDLIGECEERGCDAAYVQYKISEYSSFFHARLFRLGISEWEGAVHEHYPLPKGTKVIRSDVVQIVQKADRHRRARNRQNIALGEMTLANDPGNLRVIAHLIKDYMAAQNHEAAYSYCLKYLSTSEDKSSDEYYDVLHAQAECEIMGDDYKAAAMSAMRMLQIKGTSTAWALLAESLKEIACSSHALLRLSIFCAEQALYAGSDRNSSDRADLRGPIPCLIKSLSHHEMGDDKSALSAIELGRMIDPNHPQLQTVHAKLIERVQANGS